MNIARLFLKKSPDETGKIVDSINSKVLSDSYIAIEDELNSLRLYDKGEKEIHAPDIKNIVRNLQRTS